MVQTNSPQQDNGKGAILRCLSLGTELLGVLGVSSYLGYKLDETFDTFPWLMLSSFFVGFLGMLYMILKDAWPMQPKDPSRVRRWT